MESIKVYSKDVCLGTVDLDPAPKNMVMELLTVNTFDGGIDNVLHVIGMDHGWVIDEKIAAELNLILKDTEEV